MESYEENKAFELQPLMFWFVQKLVVYFFGAPYVALGTHLVSKLLGCVARVRIFSHVRPFYERAVSNLDRFMHRSLWV